MTRSTGRFSLAAASAAPEGGASAQAQAPSAPRSPTAFARDHPLAASPVIAGSATAAPSHPDRRPRRRPPPGSALFASAAARTAAGLAAVPAPAGWDRGSAPTKSLGYAIVPSAPDAGFALRAPRHRPRCVGAARNLVAGRPTPPCPPPRAEVERLEAEREASRAGAKVLLRLRQAGGPPAEPLADLQWDMRHDRRHRRRLVRGRAGRRASRVGIIDTGIDGSHPDIAPNFDAALSRNFTTDIPTIDGPCEDADAASTRRTSTTTGTARTWPARSARRSTASASPASRRTSRWSTSGPARTPGYFFLQPTLDALTYAGDIGIDVVNMSFYIDPWLFNCTDNPADTPGRAGEQRDDHRGHAAGDRLRARARRDARSPPRATRRPTSATRPRRHQPDYPAGTAHDRDVDNCCITVPTETQRRDLGLRDRARRAQGVLLELRHSSRPTSPRPGGDAYDSPDDALRRAGNLILAAYPQQRRRGQG